MAQIEKKRRRSRGSPPRARFDELEIRTQDGITLRAEVEEPDELAGTAILAHAVFARKSAFGKREQPGLSAALVARGLRTIAFDFRGHGDSTRTLDWGYDDLVRSDLPAVVECARARGEGKPVLVVGHSLGGHVALAAQGTQRMHVDAIVCVGANVWVAELDPSWTRRGVKAVLARAMRAAAARAGRLPARQLGLGSDDASRRFVEDWARMAHGWRSADGADDYFAGLARVTVPVAAVLGDRDWLLCAPRVGERFARACRGPVATFRAAASHAALVGEPAVLDAVAWARARAK